MDKHKDLRVKRPLACLTPSPLCRRANKQTNQNSPKIQSTQNYASSEPTATVNFRGRRQRRRSDDEIDRTTKLANIKRVGCLALLAVLCNARLAECYAMHSMELPDGIGNIFGFEPKSTFKCERDGYFGDVDNDCRLFHLCQKQLLPNGQTQWHHWTYACGNQTMFNQLTLTCAFVDEAIPCKHATRFQYLNEVIHRPKEPFLTDADVTSGISYYGNALLADGARARAFEDSSLMAQLAGSNGAAAGAAAAVGVASALRAAANGLEQFQPEPASLPQSSDLRRDFLPSANVNEAIDSFSFGNSVAPQPRRQTLPQAQPQQARRQPRADSPQVPDAAADLSIAEWRQPVEVTQPAAAAAEFNQPQPSNGFDFTFSLSHNNAFAPLQVPLRGFQQPLLPAAPIPAPLHDATAGDESGQLSAEPLPLELPAWGGFAQLHRSQLPLAAAPPPPPPAPQQQEEPARPSQLEAETSAPLQGSTQDASLNEQLATPTLDSQQSQSTQPQSPDASTTTPTPPEVTTTVAATTTTTAVATAAFAATADTAAPSVSEPTTVASLQPTLVSAPITTTTTTMPPSTQAARRSLQQQQRFSRQRSSSFQSARLSTIEKRQQQAAATQTTATTAAGTTEPSSARWAPRENDGILMRNSKSETQVGRRQLRSKKLLRVAAVAASAEQTPTATATATTTTTTTTGSQSTPATVSANLRQQPATTTTTSSSRTAGGGSASHSAAAPLRFESLVTRRRV